MFNNLLLQFSSNATFWETYGSGIVTAITVVLAVVLFFLILDKGKKQSLTTKTIVYAAISIALATVLNYATVYSNPNGGSITVARLLPLLIFAYTFGFTKGCIVGFIYGIIDFLAKPYFLNFVQFLLDYPLPFACVGFAGIFNKVPSMQKFSFILGTIITGITRFAFSTLSGVLYWNFAFVPSMAYNAILLADTAVCLVFVIVLSQSKNFLKLVQKLKNSEKQVEFSKEELAQMEAEVNKTNEE